MLQFFFFFPQPLLFLMTSVLRFAHTSLQLGVFCFVLFCFVSFLFYFSSSSPAPFKVPISAEDRFSIWGSTADQLAGEVLSYIDINLDGYSDVVVGAPQTNQVGKKKKKNSIFAFVVELHNYLFLLLLFFPFFFSFWLYFFL